MCKELNSLIQHRTWLLVPSPLNANIIGSKWVYKIKQRVYGIVEGFKVHLITKGYT